MHGALITLGLPRNRNLKTSKALLKSQAHQGTSLFTSAETNQRGVSKRGSREAQVLFPEISSPPPPSLQSQDIIFIRLLYPSPRGLPLKIKISSLQTLLP